MSTPTPDEAAALDQHCLVEEALYCADAGRAGHWPTVAGYLGAELGIGSGPALSAPVEAGITEPARPGGRRALGGCRAKIWPAWSNSWVTCRSVVRNGRCLIYGHLVEADAPQPPEATT